MSAAAASPVTLIACGGLDPGGRAGLAADLQVAWLRHARALPVLTARTAQDDRRFIAAWPTPPAELALVLDGLSLPPSQTVVKTGMLGSLANAQLVRDWALGHGLPLVLDPVWASSSGGALWQEPAAEVRAWLWRELLPYATCVTPNWPELAWLCDAPIDGLAASTAAQRRLPCPSVLKGGHAVEGGLGVDRVWDGSTLTELPPAPDWPGPRRGTGCRYASALAIAVAQGHPLAIAAAQAKADVLTCARRAENA
jgi:hydroxymethylpyrimidine/phosphomethylpyrimidine kinase